MVTQDPRPDYWAKLLALAKEHDRVVLEFIGHNDMGKPQYMVVIYGDANTILQGTADEIERSLINGQKEE